MRRFTSIVGIVFVLVAASILNVRAQALTLEKELGPNVTVEIVNRSGRVFVSADPKNATTGDERGKLNVSANSTADIAESEVKIASAFGRMRIEVSPATANKRIDISVVVPERTRLKIETAEGEVRLSGNLESAQVSTDTGTIAADVPVVDLRYSLAWTASRPRYVADFELSSVKEKAAGRFEIKGAHREKADEEKGLGANENASGTDSSGNNDGSEMRKPKTKSRRDKDQRILLNFTTDRGIVLLNVPPNEVMSDLRERPLTEAAKAIIRSGDKVLVEAIRRASPKYFGDYARTLPPAKREPALGGRIAAADAPAATVKEATVRVTDAYNRAIAGLEAADFDITENGESREILSVRPVTAPVNLVLLLDVSGSVDNYVNFIRKAARNFVETMRRDDRITVIIFNDDVKELTSFTTDRQLLSRSLDTFDAGGATAYYDALAYTLADVLRPLKGERTAIVVLTDGDDNRSFLPFGSLIGSIQESGALVYPLYVPSSLIAASASNSDAIDPVRMRYSGLTPKAQGEGERLAKVSGGLYYPISQLSQIQRAYDDIVVQLRTAYSVTFRSTTAADQANRASPRLKVKVKRDNTFAAIGPVIALRTGN